MILTEPWIILHYVMRLWISLFKPSVFTGFLWYCAVSRKWGMGTLPHLCQVQVEDRIPHLPSLTLRIGRVLLITDEMKGVPAALCVVSTDYMGGSAVLAHGDESPDSLLGLLLHRLASGASYTLVTVSALGLGLGFPRDLGWHDWR